MFEKDVYENVKIRHKKRLLILECCIILVFCILAVQLGDICVLKSEYYLKMAEDLHQRERQIKAKRGQILDRNGNVLATNEVVCTISVIHNQLKDKEYAADYLSEKLGIERDRIIKLLSKLSSIEIIKTNVAREIGDEIRRQNIPGIKVDEDYKRYYIYDDLASKVIGFTGADNQGIVGLEAKYDSYLAGNVGAILTMTDASGIEMKDAVELRAEAKAGQDLVLSIDINIQKYASLLAKKTMEEKQAKGVSIIVMNPQNGDILAMVNEPEYNLNEPFTLNYEIPDEEKNVPKMELLNKMWRNYCINDTYEPGSIFKTVTATAALETGVVSLNDYYTCPGYTVVADRRIRCHKTTGHGTQTFTESVMNSCNPAFIEWGRRVGVDNFYKYMGKLGLLDKTGIDLSGEAGIILHNKDKVGEVELATMSFGQSFQITPMQMMRAVSAIINGGTLITPHFANRTISCDGSTVSEFFYETKNDAISKKTSDTMRDIMRQVVEGGGGNAAYIEGFSIGGKTATSEKLPRGNAKYVSSFIGFSPVDNPKVVAMCLINEPQGVYYGGTIAAPVIKELYENIIPYLENDR